VRAHVGDQLVVGADRIGIVVGVPAADGSPPYIIKWQKDGHIAMVLPDQYSRIVPAGKPVAAGEQVAARVTREPGPGYAALLAWLGGRLADDLPEVAELDLTPVIAAHDGVQAVAARIRVSPTQPRDPFLRRLR
jgi:uncharacterized protein DUF1918